jgi:hypothetical protein
MQKRTTISKTTEEENPTEKENKKADSKGGE